jgi:hypothetical protein
VRRQVAAPASVVTLAELGLQRLHGTAEQTS